MLKVLFQNKVNSRSVHYGLSIKELSTFEGCYFGSSEWKWVVPTLQRKTFPVIRYILYMIIYFVLYMVVSVMNQLCSRVFLIDEWIPSGASKITDTAMFSSMSGMIGKNCYIDDLCRIHVELLKYVMLRLVSPRLGEFYRRATFRNYGCAKITTKNIIYRYELISYDIKFVTKCSLFSGKIYISY